MANDAETITLYIAQRQIKVTVKKEQVIYYRKAEKEINDEMQRFAKQWNFTDPIDFISKVLVGFVLRWIENEERLNEYIEDSIPKMEALNDLADKMKIDT